DLLGGGEAALLLLREDQLAVHADLELTAASLDERAVDAALLLDLGRQTGSPGQIASLPAVADLDVHRWFVAERPQPALMSAQHSAAPVGPLRTGGAICAAWDSGLQGLGTSSGLRSAKDSASASPCDTTRRFASAAPPSGSWRRAPRT